MKRVWIWYLVIGFILSACGASVVENTPTSAPPSEPPVNEFPLPTERGTYFSASGVCTTCHKNMIAGDGEDVSTDTFWRGTMMANAARDPYWQASVRAEVLRNPDYSAIIQDKCTTCHTPMARTTLAFSGDAAVLLDDGFLNPENDLHILAIDGISCTVCHQIEAENLGEEESYDGGFIIDANLPAGERLSYGPYEPSNEDVVLMKSASGYVPKQGKHIQSAEFCGACHTLYTPTVDNQGEIAGLFPEQMPYIEWLASDYADQQSCQDCHMPETPGEVVLSTTGSPGRGQFSQHSFAGGNIYALSLLQTYGEEIGVTASDAQIGAAMERALEQLQGQTAQISIEKFEVNETSLAVDVRVENQAGHKFPTGFPSRRVWVHLSVKDADGKIVFESGKWAEDGSIFGNDNDLDETAYEPHYQVIDNPDQVQIYEPIMGDVDDKVTTTVLRGAVYLKDNRLLPDGFPKGSESADIAVRGNASSDPNFQGSSDLIRYQVNLKDMTGPFTIQAELLYQSVGYRWAQNLNGLEAPEIQTFISYYQSVPNIPVVVSSLTTEIDS